MAKKQIHYEAKKILSLNCPINILYGGRSIGKSYAIKTHLISEAFKTGRKFIYLRRWEEDIKNTLVEGYFNDIQDWIEKLTNGQYNTISCYRKHIHLSYIDDDGELTRGTEIGMTMAISKSERYKSMQFPDYHNILFEEFVTKQFYVNNEPNVLLDIVSTVFRDRMGCIFCIGNTISAVCPYFSEWQLTGIIKQNIGTIDIYNQKTASGQSIKIAVERCVDGVDKKKSGMFFGKHAESIINGDFESQEQPKLSGKRERDYDEVHKILFEYNDFTFILRLLIHKEEEYATWFCETGNININNNTRIISNKQYDTNMHTYTVMPICADEEVAIRLLRNNKIVYSDNLTGTNFKTCYKNLCAGK